MSASEKKDSRRTFLGKAGIAVALAAAPVRAELPASPAALVPTLDDTAMPMVKLGKSAISRLVCGNNPFNGGSHTSPFINQEMEALLYARADPEDAAALPGRGRKLLAVRK